jgi:hypothetical protein
MKGTMPFSFQKIKPQSGARLRTAVAVFANRREQWCAAQGC